MSAYRCSICAINWPHTQDYKICVECGEPTFVGSDLDPIESDTARSRKNHADFERWLDQHNRRDPLEQLERIPSMGEAA